MTMSNDSLSVLNLANWSEEALYLKEFMHKNKATLPRVVKVVKGQYMNIGVPSLANSSVQQNLLLVNLGKRRRLLAQCVKFKDRSSSSGGGGLGGQKVVALGQKLAIPAEYDGYFEILSEDGRSVKCIESVAELCKRFPETVLVRENVKAFVSKSDDVDAIRDKSRVIEEGETLILVGEVLGVKGKNQTRFLRCFDQHGENIYLPYDLRSRFSAIAKEDNISGVHSASNLLNSKRLPLMARLVHGKHPKGVKNSSTFAAEMRLLSGLDEDYLVAMTLSSKEPQVIPIPVSALIKVQSVSNAGQMQDIPEFQRLVEKCQDLASDLNDEITIHDIPFARDLRLNGLDKSNNNATTYQRRKIKRNSYILTSSNGVNDLKTSPKDEYDEIEQLYDYVRGFAPLPRSAKNWRYEVKKPSEEPPEPPPIETIPSRMQQNSSPMDYSTPPTSPPISAVWDQPDVMYSKKTINNKEPKKRQRSSANENIYPQQMPHFVKSASHFRGQKNRFFRLKSKENGSSPSPLLAGQSMTLSRCNIYSPMTPAKQSSSSPAASFFQLRYKSLTNLAYGNANNNSSSAEYDTLESSNSGGKTSGDSGGSRTLPEKRSRKLSRPKSLTNLVWGNSSRYSTLLAENGKINKMSGFPQKVSSPHLYHSSKMGTVSGATAVKKLGTLYL